MDYNKDISANILLRNNSPVEGFLGLTPNQVHYLLYETFSDRSPIHFNNDINDNTLDQIPIFRIAEEYLKIINRDKYIKTTPLGALPKKVMVEIYDKRILLDECIESGMVKLWKEQDCISIMSARFTLELAGLVRKSNGKLTLTKTATKLLDANNRLEVFKLFLKAFTDKFLWSFNDGYPNQSIGQLGWAFSVYMIDKFGDQTHTPEFYSDNYLKAFPSFIEFFKSDHAGPERDFSECYTIRTFNRFLVWFGFVSIKKGKKNSDTETITRNELIKKVFAFDQV